jgi:hypothetical protein
MPSKDLSRDADRQLPLLPTGTSATPARADDVSIATITRRPTFLRAMHLAKEVSGLEDKEVYDPLEIDPGHWSRIKSGAAAFPMDERFLRFFDIVDNDIPLIWLAEARGYDWRTIRQHQSDLERENQRLREEIAVRDRAIGLLVNHHQGRGAAP